MRYYKQEFHCSAGHSHSEFVWEHELDQKKIKCPALKDNGKACNRIMKPHFEVVSDSIQILGKMSKEQIKVDRRTRSKVDFIKNTLPTINPNTWEGKHFRKKYGVKG